MPFLVYAIALAIAVGTLALSVDLATKPDIEAGAPRIAANSAVRQTPLGETSDVSRGDPHNQLSPIYPAAPGKDLPPPADVADNQGNASVAAQAAAAPDSCAVDACGSAYRSFRASDCTYQPFDGPRKLCELTAAQNASTIPASSVSRPRGRVSSRADEFATSERGVRQRPEPDDFADDGARRVIVIEPGVRYVPGVIYEER